MDDHGSALLSSATAFVEAPPAAESIPQESGQPLPRPPFKSDWLATIPFALMHVAACGVLFVDFHWWLPLLCLGSFYFRMVGLTGSYHRYFSHLSFKTGRVVQFLLGLWGTLAAQKGPLWWAAHHRVHHRHSDTPLDVHSTTQHGLVYAHVGWILDRNNDQVRWERIKDFAKFPELVWLDKVWLYPPTLLAVAIYFGFEWTLGVGMSALMWGFFLSTVILYHATFTVNSLNHLLGSRRYATRDDSTNNPWLAVLTCGEGWHNNHHRFQASCRQGFTWWEVDFTWYVLSAFRFVGLVWDMRGPSDRVLEEGGLRPARG